MAIEHAREFLSKMKSDAELVKKLETANEAEKQQIVSEMGYEFTEEEIKTAVAESGQLSDGDLEAVAGGDSAAWMGVSAGISAATVGVGSAAAA